ncbi:hypothetical protein ACFWP3_28565, partial [Streptomyces sp. NPDC058525]|uniref:hypothetical protein n=1 Tax=Streptomyces sp. NPDC058525 TaxID=3346538 RepID=UPI0036473622
GGSVADAVDLVACALAEPVFVLTETARSEYLAEQFEGAGCSVAFPRPPHGTRERGVMIASRLATSPLWLLLEPSRTG